MRRSLKQAIAGTAIVPAAVIGIAGTALAAPAESSGTAQSARSSWIYFTNFQDCWEVGFSKYGWDLVYGDSEYNCHYLGTNDEPYDWVLTNSW